MSSAAESSDSVVLFDRSLTAKSPLVLSEDTIGYLSSQWGSQILWHNRTHGGGVDAGATPGAHPLAPARRRRGGIRRKGFHLSESRRYPARCGLNQRHHRQTLRDEGSHLPRRERSS